MLWSNWTSLTEGDKLIAFLQLTYKSLLAKGKRNCVDLHLSELDLQMHAVIEQEKQQQFRGLELIAAENFTSQELMEVVGSCITNKYSEGIPGKM